MEPDAKTKLARLDAEVAKTLGYVPKTSELSKARSRCYWRARRERARHKARPAPETKNTCVCPITLESVDNLRCPCVASDGKIYEYHALCNWTQRAASSPLTRAPLSYAVPLEAVEKALKDSGLVLGQRQRVGGL